VAVLIFVVAATRTKPSRNQSDANTPVHHLTLPGPQVDPRAVNLLKYIHPDISIDVRAYCLYIVRWTPKGFSGSTGRIKVSVHKSKFFGKGGQRIEIKPSQGFSLTLIQPDPLGADLYVTYRDGSKTVFSTQSVRSVTVCAAPTSYVNTQLTTAAA
jgi:hypothetical protein